LSDNIDLKNNKFLKNILNFSKRIAAINFLKFILINREITSITVVKMYLATVVPILKKKGSMPPLSGVPEGSRCDTSLQSAQL